MRDLGDVLRDGGTEALRDLLHGAAPYDWSDARAEARAENRASHPNVTALMALDPAADSDSYQVAAYDPALLAEAFALRAGDPPAYAALRARLRASKLVAIQQWDTHVKAAAREAAQRAAVEARGHVPLIVCGEQVREMADAGEDALAQRPGDVYWRPGELVRVADHGAGPQIEALPLPSLLEALSDVATWARATEEGPDPCRPPRDVVEAIYARGGWPRLRRIEVVTDAPMLRTDGSLLQAPGYDAHARALYAPTRNYPLIPDRPTKADAQRALDLLKDPLADFCFVSPSDRSAALALILTAVGRSAVGGPCPMFLIRATTPGSGKGLLANVAGTIALGTPPPPSAAPTSTDEERKQLTTWGMCGARMVLLDNIEGGIGSDVLASALTSEVWRDRVLGANRVAEVRVPILVGTGNNVLVRGDLARRVIPIDLDPGVEHPEEREGWRHADLLAYVRHVRPTLVAAALTVLRWYVCEGRPPAPVAPFGSFEAWSAFVRGALVWVGEQDPAEGRLRLRESGDPQREADEQALEAWHETVGSMEQTVRDMIRHAGSHEGLAEGLAGLSHKLRADDLDAGAVGCALRRICGRILGGLRLERTRRGRDGALWRVVVAEDSHGVIASDR